MAKQQALLIGINCYPNLENADLRGCLNDVALFHGHLVTRFGFETESITVLRDAEASRDAILERMAMMVVNVEKDDVVVLFYAGHGSRRWPGGPDDSAIESIVPADSGRGAQPNRDIHDYEIDQWVQQLNQKTPFVTLVMDCCHSGCVTRDPFGERVRSLPGDTRSFSEWAAATNGPAPPDTTGSRNQLELAGWLAGHRQAVVLAACQADELAWEYRLPFDKDGQTIKRNGAFTFFLSEAFAQTARDATWRSVFEPLAPRLNQKFPTQHPLAEGKVDELLFGRQQMPVSSYLPVLAVDNDPSTHGLASRVTLGGGLAHAVRIGSRWKIPRIEAAQVCNANQVVVTISSVQPTTCIGHLQTAPDPSVQPGQRAILIEDVVDTTLQVALPKGDHPKNQQLRTLIEKEPLLTRADGQDTADILIQRVAQRASVGERDPCPQLGPLEAPHWAAVGPDGDLATRLQREQGFDGTEITKLVDDLVRVARFRNILAIENPCRDHALHGALRLHVKRLGPRARSRRPGSTHEPPFSEGDLADFEITNTTKEPIHFTLLELGTDYRIKSLAPYSGHPSYQIGGGSGQPWGGIALEPGATFSVRDYYAHDPNWAATVCDGLLLSLPQGFPWAANRSGNCDTARVGHIYLKLMSTSAPTDFGFLNQHGARPAYHRAVHPLQQLADQCVSGGGPRSFGPPAAQIDPKTMWSTLTLQLRVSRT